MRDLRVTFDTEAGPVEAVRGVSFSLGRERLGIVGESGSGKTMTGRSVLRLIRPPGRIEADEMTFDGHDLTHGQRARHARPARHRASRMVMQDPKFSLNPVMKVGAQLTEGLRQRDRLGRAEAAGQGHCRAGGGADPRPRPRDGRLSARAVGRHGPARDDRDDADPRTRTC